jgi:Transcriptional regulator
MSEEPRSRNASATREAILLAARQHFLKDGYDNTGLRAIATDAGIDPALINRYFGSKRQLFAEVLAAASKSPMETFLAGDRATCGERVARAILEAAAADQPRKLTFLGLVVGAMSSPEASAMAHEHIESHFIEPVSGWLGGPRAKERAWMLASFLLGVAIMKNINPERIPPRSRLAAQIQAMIDN